MVTDLRRDLEITLTHGYLSLFIKHANVILYAITGIYVDDYVSCGDKEFWEFMKKKLLDKFKSRSREVDNTVFAGVRILLCS